MCSSEIKVITVLLSYCSRLCVIYYFKNPEYSRSVIISNHVVTMRYILCQLKKPVNACYKKDHISLLFHERFFMPIHIIDMYQIVVMGSNEFLNGGA